MNQRLEAGGGGLQPDLCTDSGDKYVSADRACRQHRAKPLSLASLLRLGRVGDGDDAAWSVRLSLQGHPSGDGFRQLPFMLAFTVDRRIGQALLQRPAARSVTPLPNSHSRPEAAVVGGLVWGKPQRSLNNKGSRDRTGFGSRPISGTQGWLLWCLSQTRCRGRAVDEYLQILSRCLIVRE